MSSYLFHEVSKTRIDDLHRHAAAARRAAEARASRPAKSPREGVMRPRLAAIRHPRAARAARAATSATS